MKENYKKFITRKELKEVYKQDKVSVKRHLYTLIDGRLVMIGLSRPYIDKERYEDGKTIDLLKNYDDFIDYNMKKAKELYPERDEIKDKYAVEMTSAYILSTIPFGDDDPWDSYELTEEDKDQIYEVYQDSYKKFRKRLDNYWKRYVEGAK